MYKTTYRFNVNINGFDLVVMLWGTEAEVRKYADTELKSWYKFSGATPEEVESYKKLGGKIYLV